MKWGIGLYKAPNLTLELPMKTLLLALVALSSTSALTKPDTYWCKGTGADSGKTLYVRILSSDQAREGDKLSWLMVIRDGSETIFSGNVKSDLEDVDLGFHARGLSGMIFLDELNETWVKLNGQDMRFDCNVQP
jgi:hypothetical protein